MSGTEAIAILPDLKTSIELYRVMLRIRLAEDRVTEIYSSDKIQSPVHLSIGQEAVAAGVCLALGESNRIYGTYRSHGIYIARGGSLRGMFAELYAKETGCAKGKGGSMHLMAPDKGLIGCSAIVGSTIPVATGDAMASQFFGRKWVTCAFFGDGGVDEGIFFESLNFAALKNLPVVFVCENNAYAIHSRVGDRHARTEIHRYGEPLGVAGERYDGNDVFTVHETMKAAIAKSLAGGPPVLIEYMTYRWKEHVGPNTDHSESYRDEKELVDAAASDPLDRARNLLKKRYDVSDAELAKIESAVRAEIDDAVAFAESSAFPGEDALDRGVFA